SPRFRRSRPNGFSPWLSTTACWGLLRPGVPGSPQESRTPIEASTYERQRGIMCSARSRSQVRSALMVHSHRIHWAWLGVALVVAGCAAPAAAPRDPSAGSGAPPSAPKHLVAGILEEPKTWAPWAQVTSSGGAHQPGALLTRTLTIVDD